MDMPDGFIPLPPRVEPQAAFRPLLDDLRRTLARPPFERAVHSIYLYGSVARGEAITGRSDLDLTLVLRDPPSPELAAQLETARQGLTAARPRTRKDKIELPHPPTSPAAAQHPPEQPEQRT
ncbi:nucleotidyltransferase domain-containing protein, partial [Pseudomonas aeruginosa]